MRQTKKLLSGNQIVDARPSILQTNSQVQLCCNSAKNVDMTLWLYDCSKLPMVDLMAICCTVQKIDFNTKVDQMDRQTDEMLHPLPNTAG